MCIQKKWVLLELIELKKEVHSERIELKKGGGGLYRGTYLYCFNIIMGVPPPGLGQSHVSLMLNMGNL